ncbi:unnamed protein product [Paramecium sonneborni]|uniref:Uncharacterized protein n=1 Tax=Paramecium sonneborni TaxID=65129 RepID=A0A8S1R8Y7_9CILI|nr:unnamed protein product [Paramecium sonneborni]
MHNSQKQKDEMEECEQKIFKIKLDQLGSLYKVYNIPKVHQDVFNRLLEASQNKKVVLEEELNLMNQKLAPVQHCMFVINARENCLKQVLSILKENNNNNEVDKIKDKLKDLRMININTIECIVKWQQYFNNKNMGCIFKLDDNVPYQERLYSDYQELRPFLEDLFKVSDQRDPFFIQLLEKGEQRLYIRIRRAEAELLNLIVNNIYFK